MRFLSLDRQYAVCTDIGNAFTFTFQRSDEPHDLSALKTQWFIDTLNEAVSHITAYGVPHMSHSNSPRQRFVRFRPPAGATVEIWSGEEGGRM